MQIVTAQTGSAIQDIKWFHRINLGDTVTPGLDNSQEKLERLAIPRDLTGKTFLDVGAWDGFFSFQAEQRGAARVMATDSFVWQGKVPGYSKAGFDYARQALRSKVESLTIDPFDLSPEKVGQWDVVLLAGVVYHVKNPWMLLERAASVTRELLIVETVTGLNFWPRPAIAIYDQGFAGDKTNFCAPNVAALRAMLRDSGFSDLNLVSKSSFWHRRCVVHARKPK
jgi:tRNA (mo5U34)-methyltransferase